MNFSIVSVLALATLTAACNSGVRTSPPVALTPERSFALAPGERVHLSADASLLYLGVRGDSRCPPQVQCIQAGSAEIGLRLEDPAGSRELTLRTPDAPSGVAGPWRIELERLEFGPMPTATLRISPAPARP